MIMEAARNAKRNLLAAYYSISRKTATLLTGQSHVSKSCQIPKLRELYHNLGLDPRSGFFLEIGGFDGESFSNTSFLADQGWRGIYIEPIPKFCTTIKIRHCLNRITVEPVAVADRCGMLTLHYFDGPGFFSTTSDSTKKAYEDLNWLASSRSTTEITVQSYPLETILLRNSVPNRFDLMVVDVEGGEEQIIAGLLSGIWRPKVLIVELIDLNQSFSRFPLLVASARRTREAILNNNYETFYSDDINSIFTYKDGGRSE